MKLIDKGSVIAPPVLAGWAQSASLEIQSWPDIVSATHWLFGNPTVVDGADFYVGELELGHIHLNGESHLVLTEALKEAIIDSEFAEPFRWDANFVQFQINSQHSAQHALWLFRLAYDRIVGLSESDLLDKIALAKSTARRAATTASRHAPLDRLLDFAGRLIE
jgi:hypothetical protein